MGNATLVQQLPVNWVTEDNFRPYGQAIFATKDGKPYDREDAQLVLDRGIPRFYIMRLLANGRKFSKITRHLQCTQCLGSLEGKEWLIAVAPPQDTIQPAPEEIVAFRIPGNCFIKLDIGTWHAGPYFETEFIDFYNLELSDTNINDHDTCNLLQAYNLEFELNSASE